MTRGYGLFDPYPLGISSSQSAHVLCPEGSPSILFEHRFSILSGNKSSLEVSFSDRDLRDFLGAFMPLYTFAPHTRSRGVQGFLTFFDSRLFDGLTNQETTFIANIITACGAIDLDPFLEVRCCRADNMPASFCGSPTEFSRTLRHQTPFVRVLVRLFDDLVAGVLSRVFQDF